MRWGWRQWGEPWCPGPVCGLGAVLLHLGGVGSLVRGGEGLGGAWVDAGSAPGRSYKCVEKSDLKYPLIHGQGRQVSEWPPRRAPLKSPPAEVGAPFFLVGGCGLGLGVSSKATGCLSLNPGPLRATVRFCVLYLHIGWGCLLSPHVSLVPRLGYWEHWLSPGAWETISSKSWTQTFSSSPSCSLSHR